MRYLLIGHGYIGTAFAEELTRRKWDFDHVHYGQSVDLPKYALVINCAAYIPEPSVAACDLNPAKTISSNAIFPARLAMWCDMAGVALMHISTGCLFDEAKEYTEEDTPLRGFGGHCGMYVGTKLLAEEAVRQITRHYIMRIRLPFDNVDHPRNFLSKLMRFETVYDDLNSLTHRGDFVRAALEAWERRAPFGTYHCCNPGTITNRHISHSMSLKGKRSFGGFSKGPCSGTTLSVKKLYSVVGPMRSVENAVADCLKGWKCFSA